MVAYHNIDKRVIMTGSHPSRDYPYKGYTNRTGTDATFLIRRTSKGRRWSAYGCGPNNELCKGSYLHADTLRDLSLMLEQIK